jgi:hypothetical protein
VTISYEALLMLAAMALYVFDASMFLASNEAALLRLPGDQWSARFGLDRWRLGGKEPYLPNPATPHLPLFKLGWRFEEAGASRRPASRALAVPKALDRFRLHVLLSMICIFVLLPITLYYPYGAVFPIVVASALYLNIAVALTRLFRHRSTFGLSTAEFSVLAFECAACPPFSINLVRKLCSALKIDEDFVSAAERLLPASDRPNFKAQCLRRVDEQIDYEHEDTPRMRALQAGRLRFVNCAPE